MHALCPLGESLVLEKPGYSSELGLDCEPSPTTN